MISKTIINYRSMYTQKNLGEILRSFGNAVAIEEDGKSVSYTELVSKSMAVSKVLLDKGFPPQTRIGICVSTITDMVVCIAGTVLARCVFIPLDSAWPAKRFSMIANQANLHTIIIDAESKVQGKCEQVECLHLHDLLTAAIDENQITVPNYQEEDELYIYFTSGTTGVPKGIVGRNSSLWHFLDWEIETFQINSTQRFSQFVSPYFDAFLRDIFVPLLTGGAICVPSKAEGFLSPEKLIPWIDEEKINFIHCVPSVFRMFNGNGISAGNFRHLKYVLLSGERIVPAELMNWYDKFGSRIQLVNLYGATEATMISSYYKIQPEDAIRSKIPIGIPIADAELVILDTAKKQCKTLITGELYIVSKYLSKGYLNNPDLTAEKFVTLNGRTKQERTAFKTGDSARMLSDGSIDLLGREDRLIKVRGVRIELDEIERTLMGCSSVKNAAVVFDVKVDTIVAFVVSDSDPVDPKMLLQNIEKHVEACLPQYANPSKITILDSFPLLSNGKIDYKKILELNHETTIVAPANEVEAKIFNIWKEILNSDRISTDRTFHHVGGNSLSIMRLLPRLFSELGVRITLAELFANLTIQKQASLVMTKSQTLENAKSTIGPVKQPTVVRADVISKANDGPYYSLSSSQKRLYFLNELNSASLAYNMPRVVQLDGELDRAKLTEVMNQLVSRHESLRTAIVTIDAKVVQQVSDPLPLFIEYFESNESDAKDIIRRFIRPFDLSKAPLFRVGLIKIADHTHLMIVDLHHIISDGLSQSVLIRDFMALYSGAALPILHLQYKDYAVWQQSPDQRKRLAGARDFWKQEFADEVAVLDLPTDHARPSLKRFEGNNCSFFLSHEVTQKLRHVLNDTGSTMFMAVLSVFNVLLSKLSNQEDITVGASVAGRYHPQLEGIVGMFVNTLPLRNYPAGELSFREFLADVKTKTLACFENQTYPYEELIGELQMPRDISRNMLFDVMLVFQNYDQNELVIPGLKLTSYDDGLKTSKFDLTLEVTELDDDLLLNLEYCTELFEENTIKRFIGYFQRIVAELTENPDKKLSRINILTDAERTKQVYTFNNTATAYPINNTVINLFKEQVSQGSNKVALYGAASSMTYSELDEKSAKIAMKLKALGVQQNDRVGIIMEPSEHLLVAVLGVLKSGAAFVPVDKDYPEARKMYMMQHSGVQVLISTTHLLESLQLIAAAISGAHIIDLLTVDYNSIPPMDLQVPSVKDLAYVLYTSGSTGLPKGAMITHGALSNYLSWANDTYIQGETHAMALFTSISFDLTITSMFLPLISGNTLYVYQQKEQSALIEQVVRDGYATILKLTPSHLKILSESDVDIRSVKRLIVGGEQFSADLAAAIFDKGNIALEIYNEYGPTEATIGCVLHQYSREESFLRSSVLIGKPAPNNHVYVLDRHLNLLPIGVAGELYIGGAQLFKGYISSEDQTRAKLIGNPYRENDMLYKAGDLVRCLADGNLEFLGRIDDQVKVRGYRIELGEIESMLSGYDNVRDSVVLVKDSEGDKHLIAYYVSDDEISSAKLRSYLSLRLPEYMLPAYYMHLERLPLTANGKLDRKALPEPQLVDDNYMAPSLGFEERLVDIWSEVLRIERSKISVNRNFFDLGGDSIRLIYLANKLKKDFKVKLSIAALFNAPTILSQASMLDNAFEESSRTQFHIEQETETRDETLNLLDSINN